MLRVLLFSLLAGLAGSSELVAQLNGRVLDESGNPLQGVLVEAWSASDRVARTQTDDAGRFAFTRPIALRTRSLYVYRYGYQAIRPQVGSTAREYTFRLRADPVVLDGIVVDVAPPVCRPEEDDEARALWRTMASRYDAGIAELGIATYLASAIVTVPVSELGPVQVRRPGVEQRGSAPLFRASWGRRVERSGYARRLSAASPDGMFEAWGYPPLEADFATHFVDPVFGKLHRFTIEEANGDGWTIRFCPRDDDKPSIRGVLKLASDTTMSYAEWLFDTPEPHEGAGGRVHYADIGSDGLRLPLPAEGLFWRRADDGRYRERYQSYEGWIVSPGDSVPFLPVREDARAGERR